MTTLNDPQALADALGVDVATVNAWATDLSVVADGCLSTLDPVKAERALYYLTGYWINNEAGTVTSESLGDASMSWAERKGGMAGDPWGKMALMFAPCLAAVSPTSQMRVWLVS